MNYQNIRQAKTIEAKNKKRLLEVNPKLNDKPGIYFFLRTNEEGFKFAYIGQALSIIQRCCGHMVGYQQHIDLSLKRHKLYSEKKEMEIYRGMCLFGPQKDDFRIMINSKNSRYFSSQGQQRTAVLCLKLAEGELSVKITAYSPYAKKGGRLSGKISV